MTKKTTLKPVAAVVGAALVGSLTAMNVSAADNPFGASQLEGGYMQLASSEGGEMKEGEGKCGGETKEGEGKCGGESKEGEGKCGEGMMKEGEGKCGEGKEMKEGKCGEGKCGGKN